MPDRAADYSLVEVPAKAHERRLARVVMLASLATFLAIVPFAKVQLAPVFAFIPVYQSMLAVGDLVTAILLFGHFAHSGSRRPFLLANGYLFTAFTAIAHMFTFPGLFAPTGLFGAGPQSTAWLYMAWHAGFPLFVLAYVAQNKRRPHGDRRFSSKAQIVAGIALNLLVVVGLTAFVTAGQDLLPPIMDGNRYTSTMAVVVTLVWSLSAAALLALWRSKSRTILDVWLMVTMCAWTFDIALSAVLNGGRFDLGFYGGRIFGLMAASFVLVTLLVENAALYAQAQNVATTMSAKFSASERTFSAFMEHGPFAACLSDSTGKVLFANAAMERLDARTVTALTTEPSSPDYQVVRVARLATPAAPGKSTELWITLDKNESSERSWHVLKFPVEVDGRQSMTGILAIDITEQKRAERAGEVAQMQLQQAYKMASVGALAADFAQEIEGLLTGIKDKGQQVEAAIKIAGGLRMISEPVDENPLRNVSVAELVEGTLAICAARFRRGGVELDVRPIPKGLTFECRANEISQILLSLLNNAYDALEGVKNPKAELEVTAREGVLKLIVTDNGPGIPAEIRKKIMQSFFTTKRAGKATGLGLSISRSLAQGHGGSLMLEEQSKLTRFVLRVPLSQHAGENRRADGA